MIALKEKPKATKCSDQRTISLIAHTERTVTRILRRRIKRKFEDILGEDQFKFRRAKETSNAIGISERTLEMCEELCACFIN
jgi:hypothetical protein